MEDGYKQYVELMRDWYKRGLLDQNFITNNATIMGVLDYIGTGKAAASVNLWGHTSVQLKLMGYNNDEDFDLVAAKYPVLNVGDTEQCGFNTSATVKECNAISAKTADKELVLRYMDYWYSDECMLLDSMGIEGDSYAYEGDTMHLGPVLREKIADGTVSTVSQAMSLWTLGTSDFGLYNWGMFEVQNEDDLSAMNSCDVWNTAKFDLMLPATMTNTDAENTEFTSLYTDIQTLANENTVKFITGEQSMDQWDAFQSQLKNYGVERCIELKQAALDRYNAR
jgi:putative aldouronate transport system substrate-binding protein